MLTGENTENPKKEKDLINEGQKVDATCFHICGDTPADVDLAKKLLSQNPQTIKNKDIPEHWQHMPDKTTCQAFVVNTKTSEYDEILRLFQASCKRTVKKVTL